MNYKKAFYYFAEDKNWIKKFAIGCLIQVIPFFGLAVNGYLFKVIDSRSHNKKELPEWRGWEELFIDGFYLSIIGLVYALPLLIITGFLFIGSIPPVPSFFIVAFAYAAIILFLTPVIIVVANLTKYSFRDVFSVRQIVKISRQNFKKVISIVLSMLLFIIISLGLNYILAPFVSIGSILIIFLIRLIIYFYFVLVLGYLLGQLVEVVPRKVKPKTEPKEASCYNCDSPLKPGSNYCTSCGASQNVCPSCHEERKEGSEFCQECGQRFI